jgi:hypothetical protein
MIPPALLAWADHPSTPRQILACFFTSERLCISCIHHFVEVGICVESLNSRTLTQQSERLHGSQCEKGHLAGGGWATCH